MSVHSQLKSSRPLQKPIKKKIKTLQSKSKCVANLVISKIDTKSLIDWFNMFMNSYPKDHLEEFYRNYLGSRASIDEFGQVDLDTCIKISNQDDISWESSISEQLPKDCKLPTFPYAASAFFGFKFSHKTDCEKLVTYNEMDYMLGAVSYRDTGRTFFDRDFDSKNILVRLFSKNNSFV